MDGVDIPALVRRVRVVKGFTQAQLADEYDVHPTTVGRWEAGNMSPAPAILGQLYKALVEAHPVWTREFIDSSPVPKYIHHIEDIGLGIVVSNGTAIAFDSTKNELLDHWLTYCGPIIPELYKQAQAHPDFEACHHIEAVFPYVNNQDFWWHTRAVIIEDATSVLWEGSMLPMGPGQEPQIKVVTDRDMAEQSFSETVRLQQLHRSIKNVRRR